MIISASRRSDIPCYYSEWFLNRLKAGYALIPNPRNANRLGRAELSPRNVDCIVFWTKNPAPMMNRLPLIEAMGYAYYFEFTVTAYGRETERNLPEKETVIDTFKRLSDKVGPKGVDWRFDPILKNEKFSPSWIAGILLRGGNKPKQHGDRTLQLYRSEESGTVDRSPYHGKKGYRTASRLRLYRECRHRCLRYLRKRVLSIAKLMESSRRKGTCA